MIIKWQYSVGTGQFYLGKFGCDLLDRNKLPDKPIIRATMKCDASLAKNQKQRSLRQQRNKNDYDSSSLSSYGSSSSLEGSN